MNFKTAKRITLLTAVVISLLFTAGCYLTIDDNTATFTFSNYSGKAVNVKAAATTDYWKSGTESLEGASISLYAYNTTTGSYNSTAYKQTTVGSDGKFIFLAPDPGKYKLTGLKTGWTFVPRYIEIVNSIDISEDLYAYPVDGSEYTLIASWKNTDMDVDLILTYGNESIDAATFGWNTGNSLAGVDRYKIYSGDENFAGVGSTAGVKLDRDVTATDDESIPRVETISIYSNAWFVNGDTLKVYIDAPSDNDLLTGNYFTADGSSAKPAAIVQLDIMRRFEGADYHYGTWYAPLNTYEDTIQLIQAPYTDDETGTYLTFNSANSAVYLNGVTESNDPIIRNLSGE